MSGILDFLSSLGGAALKPKRNSIKDIYMSEGGPGAPFVNPDPGGLTTQLGWRGRDWMGGVPPDAPHGRQDQPGFAINPGAAWERQASGLMNVDDLRSSLSLLEKRRKAQEEEQAFWKRLGVDMPTKGTR